MSDIKNDRLIRAIRKQKVDTTPIWIMRQAGRYLPEYRRLRQQAGSFMNLCQNPELACEVTLQPLKRFDLDAAIIFSDILTIPDAMGLGLYFVEDEGPKFRQPIKTDQDIDVLPMINPRADLDYVMQAIKLTTKELNVPLIGFVGSPWTLSTYMIEGGSSKHFTKVKSFAFQHTEAMLRLLDKLAVAAADSLIAQIEAGVSVVQIFDSWGGVLSEDDYQKFSLKYMQKMVAKIKNIYPNVPVILFTKGGGLWLESMLASKADVLGLDWTINIGKARARVGEKVSLQGNLDPNILSANAELVTQSVVRLLADYGFGSGHVFNLGHGIKPHVNHDNVKRLVDTVHNHGVSYH